MYFYTNANPTETVAAKNMRNLKNLYNEFRITFIRTAYSLWRPKHCFLSCNIWIEMSPPDYLLITSAYFSS